MCVILPPLLSCTNDGDNAGHRSKFAVLLSFIGVGSWAITCSARIETCPFNKRVFNQHTEPVLKFVTFTCCQRSSNSFVGLRPFSHDDRSRSAYRAIYAMPFVGCQSLSFRQGCFLTVS